MNRRRKLKQLKKQNDLMRRIIKRTPEMERLYQAYNDIPKNITYTKLNFERLVAHRTLPLEVDIDSKVLEAYREWLARDIYELAKKFIYYNINNDGAMPKFEAEFFVGHKVQ